ncbi:NUDIX hydrolase [Actinocorallia aurantiaca]|uniref:NUDIX hydrolase n=1 Tax=Actinocorallia aurantiaca TaxID=46204 RepID=A0ABP6GSM5_9ACTN
MGVQRRDAARVVLIDSRGRVLLFKYLLSEPWACEGWMLPGGRIEPGESPEVTASRELLEETGLTPDELWGPVATNSGEWSLAARRFTTVNWFYVARTTVTAVDLTGQSAPERQSLLAHRWWSSAELEATQDVVLPPRLAPLLRAVLAGDLDAEPLTLPWR